MILGDNGNIFRIVGISGTRTDYAAFNYDNYGAEEHRRRGPPSCCSTTRRAGRTTIAAAANDIGAADEIHGESGDDFIYGMAGNDVLFGEGQDDDLIGGYGQRLDLRRHRRGRRPRRRRPHLHQPQQARAASRSTASPRSWRRAERRRHRHAGQRCSRRRHQRRPAQLKKTVNLTPFNVDPTDATATSPLLRPDAHADDIIYGGLGERLPARRRRATTRSPAPRRCRSSTPRRVNPGDVLRLRRCATGEFARVRRVRPAAQDPGRRDGNFTTDGTGTSSCSTSTPAKVRSTRVVELRYGMPTDGDDAIFGDLGNDWLVGGTGATTSTAAGATTCSTPTTTTTAPADGARTTRPTPTRPTRTAPTAAPAATC